MRAELIAIGTELLRLGRRDSNTEWMTDRLVRLGVDVRGRSQLADDPERIVSAVRDAASRCELLLLSGGLGPTDDDRTRQALAEATGRPLRRDRDVVERLRRAFEQRGRRFHANQERQADLPEGARWLSNPRGTAQGIELSLGDCRVAALPGVPAELRAMFDREVERWVPVAARRAVAHRTLRVGGRGEGSVDAQLCDLYDAPGVEVTVLAGRDAIEVHLLSDDRDGVAAEARVARVAEAMAERLGDDLCGTGEETLAERVARELVERGETLSVAESCTAGLLGGTLTTVPGASAWFRGGVIVYDNALKRDLAGVAAAVIEREGAVSEPVARALAEGTRRRLATDWAVAITGIAGPGGGTPGKPVGTVHVGIAGPDGTTHAGVLQVGDRELIRRRTVTWALDRLRRRLEARGRRTG